MTPWKFTDSSKRVVARTLVDGSTESMLWSALPEGEVVEAADPPTFEQSEAELQRSVQTHLDAGARSRRWDNIHTAALRAGFKGPFQAEGIAYADWMDQCWAYCYEVLADVKVGKRGIPTAAELLDELPPLLLLS